MAAIEELLAEWGLVRDGADLASTTSQLVPVLTGAGIPGVLKIVGSGEAGDLEHLALTRWDGDGAVRLLRADPRRRALLVEWCTGETLSDAWDQEACEIVAGLYSRLHRPVGEPFVRLSTSLAAPLAGLATLPRSAPLPRRLVEQAISLGRDFATDGATDGILVHTDLHFSHVLGGERGWMAISPKPLSGDPHFEPSPMLWHRFDELADDVRDGVRRRFHTLIDSAGLDEARARDWVVVRMMIHALGALSEGDRLTRCIAIAKAVQD